MRGNYCFKTDWALLHLWEGGVQLISCDVMTYCFLHFFFFFNLKPHNLINKNQTINLINKSAKHM